MINNLEIYKGDTVFWGDEDNYSDLYEFCREKRVETRRQDKIVKNKKKVSLPGKLFLFFKSIWKRSLH